METLHTKNYPILFKTEGYRSLINYISEKKPSQIVVLTDTNTKEFCLTKFKAQLSAEIDFLNFCIPEGETNKNLSTCELVWDFLSKNKVDRKALMILLGGGVVTDLGGFVASTYQRGIAFINVPTTLLAMVDASIGGKTGVDLGVLKNQIGVINNPEMVLVDTEYLNTLPKNEFTSGIAEMLKHGLIASEEYWNLLTEKKVSINEQLEKSIRESIIIKNTIVEKDPKETGLRKTLNFGHTLGHAIESCFLSKGDKQRLLHGEAIAVGMILAIYLSKEAHSFSEEKTGKIISAFRVYYGKVDFNKEDIQNILHLLQFDKKNENGKINFVLLSDIGEPILDNLVSSELILKAFDYYKEVY